MAWVIIAGFINFTSSFSISVTWEDTYFIDGCYCSSFQIIMVIVDRITINFKVIAINLIIIRYIVNVLASFTGFIGSSQTSQIRVGIHLFIKEPYLGIDVVVDERLVASIRFAHWVFTDEYQNSYLMGIKVVVVIMGWNSFSFDEGWNYLE